MKFSLVALNGRYTHSCLALYYVRNELEKKIPGCAIAIHQLTINDPYYDTLLGLTEEGATAIFFSVYIWNAQFVKRLIHDLHKVVPATPIILGGPEATTLVAEKLPRNCTIIRGPIEGMEHIFYDDLTQNKLKRDYAAKHSKDFDYPYRGEDFTSTLKNRSVYYESTRGCPFSCSYCLSAVDKGLRSRDLAKVKEDLAHMLRHNPKTVRFVDRTFNANPERTTDIWRYLAEKGGDILFHFEIAPDLFTDEMFSLLRAIPPGRFQFEIGIQSTNPETLAAVNRPMDFAKAADNIKKLMALDAIHLHADLILGLPFETEETFKKSFNDVFSLFPHYIQMGLLKILPGTPISQSLKEYGMTHCSQPPYEVLATKWIDHATLGRVHKFGECVEAFFNTRFFRATMQYIHNRGENAFEFFSGLTSVCEQNNFFRLAKTPDFMSRMLHEYGAGRDDGELIHDLLRYDWLRCGHRYLPDYLVNQDLKAEKDKMWNQLPDEYPPFYDKKSRNVFFKRSMFAHFSRPTIKEVLPEMEAGNNCICFLPEEASAVFKFQKTTLL